MKRTLVILLTLATTLLYSQIPQDIPHQTDPVDFTSPLNIAFYIGIPLLMVIVYVLLRRRRKKMRD